MTTETAPAPTLQRFHHIELNTRGEVEREEITTYLPTEWRGQAAVGEFVTSRYRSLDTSTNKTSLTPWQTHLRRARAYNPESPGGRGPDLTETARTRLSERHRDEVSAWANPDDSEYAESFDAALFDALLGEVKGAAEYSLDRVEGYLAAWSDNLGRDRYVALAQVLTAKIHFYDSVEFAANLKGT